MASPHPSPKTSISWLAGQLSLHDEVCRESRTRHFPRSPPRYPLKEQNEISTRERGQKAEQIAVDHLLGQGYRVVERNFRCKLGEIDIIATQAGELVFVEVRSRKSALSLDPIHSVNRRKQQQIIKAAQFYLARRFRTPPLSRFDVVLVTLGSAPQVEVIPNAFQVDSDLYYRTS
ncbi:MAG: YraN family protein [Desulfomonile tiedjei]|nr:YraN family protein [Desulfomonile tiedjei]